MRTSQFSGYYKLSPEKRLEFVRQFANLTEEEVDILRSVGSLEISQADRMIENVVGTMPLPLGIAVNFRINQKDYLIPMAIEEPSVVAAASYMAKLARNTGGFTANTTPPIMIGQIQLTNVPNPYQTRMKILERKEEILRIANEQDPVLLRFGGGARDVEVRVVQTRVGPMVVTHLLVDTRDAMGANAVNTMAEAVAPYIEEITGGKVYLRIISNLAVHRLARAYVTIKKDDIGGEKVVDGIIQAHAFAEADPYRAATHNKGVMNGVDAVVVATGNDWRAIEAGAHAYAARHGEYTTLTHWEKDLDGNLAGSIELPVALGTVGGATKVHPVARVALKILGVKTARELGEVVASVGLAQNLAALRALVSEGIQRGHMSLHARNIAAMVGARGEEIDQIAEQLVKEKKIRVDRAEELLREIRGG
ncbi:MAG: hydroxymethylglutaryl-CoA reductase, degradative [Methanobacteriota archaeon]|nr:MAG: hydroxymethylglutaryl-CoA reductase, degradative [Euryarchaeota archaeon]